MQYLDRIGLGTAWTRIKSWVKSYVFQATADRAVRIPYGTTDSTSTSTVFTATVDGIPVYDAENPTTLANGTHVFIKNTKVTSAAASTDPKCWTLNVNGYGAKKVYVTTAAATYATTQFTVNYKYLFVYDSSLDSNNGGWYICQLYDSNTNTIGYQIRTASTTRKTTDACRYYKVFFSSADDTHWVPAAASTTNSATSAKTVNQRPIDPFGPIVYFSSTTSLSAGSNVSASYVWQQYNLTFGYSFNRTGAALTLTTQDPVYIKCAPQADGSAIIDKDNPFVQELPDEEDGKIYIFFGVASAATTVELNIAHPIYYVTGSTENNNRKVRIWTNPAVASAEVQKYNSDKTDESEGTADYGQTDVVINGNVSTIVTTQAPPSAVRQYIAPSWRAMNQKLAEKADADDVPQNLHVTLTSSTSGNTTTYTADHTHAEITAALASGGVVDVTYDYYLYAFDGEGNGDVYFRRVDIKDPSRPNTNDNVYEKIFLVQVVNGVDKWTKQEDNPLIPDATTSNKGLVQLNDAVNSTSTSQAATANAVKKVKDAIPTKTSDLTNDSNFLVDHGSQYSGVIYGNSSSLEDTQIQDNASASSYINLNPGGITINTEGTSVGDVAITTKSGGKLKVNNNEVLNAGQVGNGLSLTNGTLKVNQGSTLPTNGYDETLINIESDTSKSSYNIPSAVLPWANTSRRGIVKVGDGLMTGSEATLKVNVGDGLQINTTSKELEVCTGDGLTINEDDGSVEVDSTIISGASKGATSVQSVTITQSVMVGTGGTSIKVDDGSTYRIVADGEPGGSSNGCTAPTWGAMNTALGNKQDTISDLSTIRSGASAGATAIQPTDIKDELDPGGNGEIADSAAIAAYIDEATLSTFTLTLTASNPVGWYRVMGLGQYFSGVVTLSGAYYNASPSIATFVIGARSNDTANDIVQINGSKNTNIDKIRLVSNENGDHKFYLDIHKATAAECNKVVVTFNGYALLTDEVTNTVLADVASTYIRKTFDLINGSSFGNITASKFITSGGTSSQFIKGDGTLDSNTYATRDNAVCGGDYITNSNSANTGSTKKDIFINHINDRLYAANSRFYVTHKVFDSSDDSFVKDLSTNVFSGNLEQHGNTISEGQYAELYIGTEPEATLGTNSSMLWTYGNEVLYLTFYTGRYPDSIDEAKLYYKYNPAGWDSCTITKISSAVYKIVLPNKTYPAAIKIKWSGSSSRLVSLSDVKAFGGRSTLNTEGVVTKYGIKQDLWGDVEAPKFIKRGGTSSQFLKADGSVDSKNYLTDNEVYTKSEVDTKFSGINRSIVIGALPASGTANVIYRVPGTNSYADYMWDGSTFVKLAEFDGSIFMQVTEAQYEALSETEKNNGTWYFIEEE